MSKVMALVDMMAAACHCAQAHIDDSNAWDISDANRELLLQCVSYQMACFLSQNTEMGGDGVDWDVVLDELVEHPMKSEDQWVHILNEKAQLLGGWYP